MPFRRTKLNLPPPHVFSLYENKGGGEGVDSGRSPKNRLFIIQFFHRRMVPAFLTFLRGVCTTQLYISVKFYVQRILTLIVTLIHKQVP